MRKLIILLFTVFSNLIYSQVSNEILDKNFMEAIKWENNLFIVINLKDNKTQKFEEVCVTNQDLLAAIGLEKKLDYDEAINLLRKSYSRNYEFTNLEANALLKSHKYSINELSDFEDKVNIEEEIKKINKDWFLDYNKILEKEYLYGYSLTKRRFIIGFSFDCFGPSGLMCLSCQEK